MEIPVDLVDDNEIPRESGIKIEEVYKMVGALYFDYHFGLKREQERYSVIIEELKKKLLELEAKNTLLEEQLRKLHEQKVFNKPNNSRENAN